MKKLKLTLVVETLEEDFSSTLVTILARVLATFMCKLDWSPMDQNCVEMLQVSIQRWRSSFPGSRKK